MQAPKAFDSPRRANRGAVAGLRYRLNQGWPKVLTALPPKRELIFTPLNATYKVVADYFALRAHNGSSHKREAQMITVPAPIRAFSVPGPRSLFPAHFAVSSPKIDLTPTPLPCGNHFFGPSVFRNSHVFNSMHFHPVDESVTANRDFCPYLTPKRADLTPKSLFFASF